MFTPLLDKLAEPPPPEGVSVQEWDEILEKGPTDVKTPIAAIRKAAAALDSQRAFEELTAPGIPTTEDLIDGEKFASAEDIPLLKQACDMHRVYEEGSVTNFVVDIPAALQTYEELGGTYKHAFGQQMFDSKQMAGSPAVSGGMAARAKTPAPQVQQAPVSVTTTSFGGTQGQQQGAVSTPSQTSTPSAPTG